MRIVAIVPVFNERSYVADLIARFEQLRSALAETELVAVFVDAGSTDGTAEIFKDSLHTKSWLQVIEVRDFAHFGKAFAKGATVASKILAPDFFLDIDRSFLPSIEDLSALFSAAPNCDLAFGTKRTGEPSASCLRLIRFKGMLEHFDFSKIETIRAAYKVHLVSFLERSGARVLEVPMRIEAPRCATGSVNSIETTWLKFSLWWREIFSLPGWDRLKSESKEESPKLSVCTLTTSFPRFEDDDSSIFVRRMVDAIVDAGCEETVIVPRVSGEPEYEESRNFRIFRVRAALLQRSSEGFGAGLLPNLKRHPVRGLFELPLVTLRLAQAAALCWRKGTVFHANWIMAGASAWLVSLVTGGRYVVTLRGSDAMLLGIPGVRFVYRVILARARAVTVVGESLGVLVREKIPSLAPKLSVIENGVRVEQSTADKDYETLRHYELKEKTYVVAVGSIIPRKGIGVLIELIATLPENFVLVLCGKLEDKTYEAELRSLIAEKNVAARVKFLGAIPPKAIAPILRSAKAFLSAASFEGRPNAVLEALASGCPVFISDIDSHRELVTHAENGYLFSAADIAQAGKNLADLLSNDTLRKNFAAAAQRRVKDLSWSRTAEKYIAVLSI